jgi:serine/tyrosine/threonine adenylyltransferase
MPISPAYRPDPRFPALGGDYADPVAPAKFPKAILRYRNDRWAARVGLGGMTRGEWEAAFARFEPLPSNLQRPLAMRYHGHQFGTYNPDIGDGRGFLYAQLRDDEGRLLDLATKGSGQTPYSRFGDGRLTLKGGVREVLATEMLEALGVYTSKSFSLYETGEALERGDEPSPTRSSVLTRLGHSHIRFGAFQRLFYFDQNDLIRKLVAHCLELYYPGIDPARGAAGLLAGVVQENARLAASWIAAGFVHGVLNTDNMTITGESMDYGPWRFLPRSDPNFVAAYFDEGGRYRFGQQANIVSWNFMQLSATFRDIAEDDPLMAAMAPYPDLYRVQLRDHMFQRLGLETGMPDTDLAFLQKLFAWLTETGIGWEQFFFDWFCGQASTARAARSPQAKAYSDDSFAAIGAEISGRKPVRPRRLTHPLFQRATPVTLLIEDVEALWAPIAEKDDWSLFEAKLKDIDAWREALDFSPRRVNAP